MTDPDQGIDLLQVFSTADNVTAVAAASYVLSIAARGLWRRTLGSRRATTRKLHSLTPGNPRDLIESLFGLPIYIDEGVAGPNGEDEKEVVASQRLYNAAHGWLTVHYENDKVTAFAFMLTDKAFRFELGPICRGMVSGTLGRKRYIDIDPDPPLRAWSFVGPYNYGYTESHGYGRSGNYQTYAFSTTMHGWSTNRRFDDLPIGIVNIPPQHHDEPLSENDVTRLSDFRRLNSPDTVAVFGANSATSIDDSSSGTFDQDDMRNLEGRGPRGWLSRSEFARRHSRSSRLRPPRRWLDEQEDRWHTRPRDFFLLA